MPPQVLPGNMVAAHYSEHSKSGHCHILQQALPHVAQDFLSDIALASVWRITRAPDAPSGPFAKGQRQRAPAE